MSSYPPPPPRRRVAPVEPAAPTRADRRGENRYRRRRGRIVIAVIAVLALVAAGAAFALSSGESGPEFEASTTVELEPGLATLEYVPAFQSQIELPADVRDQMLGAIGTYIDDGIVVALRRGKAPNPPLAEAFDQGALAALEGPDRASLLDEGLPKAVGKIKVTSEPISFSGLVVDGNVVVATANVSFTITARAEQGVIRIERSGEFDFAPDASGAWKVSGWKIDANRSGPGVTPAPTTTLPGGDTATTAPGSPATTLEP
jgi:hypothetical protein